MAIRHFTSRHFKARHMIPLYGASTSPTVQPYRAVAGQAYVPGMVAGQAYVPGSQAGQAYVPGSVAGQGFA